MSPRGGGGRPPPPGKASRSTTHPTPCCPFQFMIIAAPPSPGSKRARGRSSHKPGCLQSLQSLHLARRRGRLARRPRHAEPIRRRRIAISGWCPPAGCWHSRLTPDSSSSPTSPQGRGATQGTARRRRRRESCAAGSPRPPQRPQMASTLCHVSDSCSFPSRGCRESREHHDPLWPCRIHHRHRRQPARA